MPQQSSSYLTMTVDEKHTFIERLLDENKRLKEELERLKKPKKTSKNSSLPPAQTEKGNLKKKPKKAVKAHGQGGRALSEVYDEHIIAKATQCMKCSHEFTDAEQKLVGIYDKISIPEIRPYIRRIERYAGSCPECKEQTKAVVPEGMEEGSPFDNSVKAMALYYRYTNFMSYERLKKMFADIFKLDISEGALANLFMRTKEEIAPDVQRILQGLQQSRLVASDETSARVSGTNQWEWVFQNEDVCLHVIRPSRGADVIHEVLKDHQPEIWVSDLFSSQTSHPAKTWQVCLAHQLRDCQYAIDAGDQRFARRMKNILLRAFVIHNKRHTLKSATLLRYRRNLLTRFESCLAIEPESKDGKRLKKRYLKLKDNLFLFLEDSTIPPTNNSSEQAIRMSTIFRKVTNCFRSNWGRDLFADIRSIINTGKRQGLSPFDAINTALNPNKTIFS